MAAATNLYDEWMNALQQGVGAQLDQHPDSTLYALLDGAQIENLERQIGKWKPVFAASLFTDTKEATLTDVSPWLIELPKGKREQAQFIKRCIELQGAAHALTWLISPASFEQLLTSLVKRMDAKLPGDMDMLLRYFDTYRLPDLQEVLNDEQRQEFFGCAHCWLYINRSGELASIQAQYNTNDSFTALQFDEKQEQAILDKSFPDELLRILQKDQADLVETLPPQQRYDTVKLLIDQAKSYNIEGTKDLLYFCIVGLNEGPGFESSPEWADVLAQAKAGKSTFADAALAQST